MAFHAVNGGSASGKERDWPKPNCFVRAKVCGCRMPRTSPVLYFVQLSEQLITCLEGVLLYRRTKEQRIFTFPISRAAAQTISLSSTGLTMDQEDSLPTRPLQNDQDSNSSADQNYSSAAGSASQLRYQSRQGSATNSIAEIVQIFGQLDSDLFLDQSGNDDKMFSV